MSKLKNVERKFENDEPARYIRLWRSKTELRDHTQELGSRQLDPELAPIIKRVIHTQPTWIMRTRCIFHRAL
jgi:hypothetical protein